MKLALLIANTLLSTGIFCSHGQVHENDDISKGRAIQIISPVNHSFHLNSNDLNPILESDEIKDRHVVVVSIAGAFRKGKSFLLNFFLRYLYAQYKKHDVTDWLESSGNDSVLNGFKWRGGRKPETTGIWMWSEMFTHDFENGEKIVIILLDTQGIFDHQSSIQDCTKTFALSIMLSSVQCYNLMQNLQENDLQNLDLFSEYGRLVMEQTHQKPFQHLVILIRDWPFAYETGYGWSQSVIDELMTSNEEQMSEMRESRQRIRSSFGKISAFLMPYPGTFVAQGTNFTGDLKQIDPEFLKYVKELMPAMFEPKNLVLKRINGEKVRARDLLQYLQAYLNIFNGRTLPEPKSVLMATAEASNLILFNDVMDLYTESMQNAIQQNNTYFSESKLLEIHIKAKNETILKFVDKRKLGSDEHIALFRRRIETDSDKIFQKFKEQNDDKRKIWTEKTDLRNEKLANKIGTAFEKEVCKGIQSIQSMTTVNIDQLLTNAEQNAFYNFNSEKIGDDDISGKFHEILRQNLDEFKRTTNQMLSLYINSVDMYSNSMQNSLNIIDSYASQSTLLDIHQNAKKEALSQFHDNSQLVGVELRSIFQNHVESMIYAKYTKFREVNERKRQTFIMDARRHNEHVSREIEEKYKTSSLSSERIRSALREYDMRKMGDYEISADYRIQLERNLNNQYISWNSNNNDEIKKVALKVGGIAGSAAVGGFVAGPVGALVGGLLGGALSLSGLF